MLRSHTPASHRTCSGRSGRCSAPSVSTAPVELDTTEAGDDVLRAVVTVARHTRQQPGVQLGASSRAAIHMLAATKAHARLDGRDAATVDDVRAVAPHVLRHRLILDEGIRAEDVLGRALARDLTFDRRVELSTRLARVPGEACKQDAEHHEPDADTGEPGPERDHPAVERRDRERTTPQRSLATVGPFRSPHHTTTVASDRNQTRKKQITARSRTPNGSARTRGSCAEAARAAWLQ